MRTDRQTDRETNGKTCKPNSRSSQFCERVQKKKKLLNFISISSAECVTFWRFFQNSAGTSTFQTEVFRGLSQSSMQFFFILPQNIQRRLPSLISNQYTAAHNILHCYKLIAPSFKPSLFTEGTFLKFRHWIRSFVSASGLLERRIEFLPLLEIAPQLVQNKGT